MMNLKSDWNLTKVKVAANEDHEKTQSVDLYELNIDDSSVGNVL